MKYKVGDILKFKKSSHGMTILAVNKNCYTYKYFNKPNHYTVSFDTLDTIHEWELYIPTKLEKALT